MKRIAITAVLLTLAVAAPAQASASTATAHATTLIIWTVPPPPSPMPLIVAKFCPTAAGAQFQMPCYLNGTVYMVPYPHDPAGTRDTVQHELGHAYDERNLSDGERNRIGRVLGWRRWHDEVFADFYAGCRLRLDPRNPDYQSQDIYPNGASLQHVAATCRLIARAGI